MTFDKHSNARQIEDESKSNKTSCARVATQYAPAQTPRAPPSRHNVAVLSHAEYVPTLTAATLRVKAALSKATL